MLQSAPPAAPRGAPPTRGGLSMRARSGGISKHGRGPRLRKDKDGDLDMDASSKAGARGGRGGARGVSTRGAAGPRNQRPTTTRPHRNVPGTKLGLVDCKVTGWGSSEEDRELTIEFIENKANVKVKKSKTIGKILVLSIPNAQVPSVLALDNTPWKDTFLIITAPRYVNLDPEATEKKTLADAVPVSKDTADTIRLLENVLASRYKPEAKFLDLSNLGQDPVLKNAGFFELSSTTSKMFPALMLVADKKFKTSEEKKEAVQTVSLAHNSLPSISPVTSLSTTFPGIKNLSLEGNNLQTWRDIDGWKFRFRDLEQLVLTGNPITTSENYAPELCRRYPKLIMLDNVVLDRAQIGLPAPLPQPPKDEQKKAAGIVEARHGESGSALPIQGSFTLDTDNIGLSFLMNFFSSYDNNKDQVIQQYYDNSSTFSLSANTLAPRINQPGVSIPPKPWEVYYPFSRNLQRVHNTQTQSHKLYVGSDNIKRAWTALPKTHHNTADPSLWVYDIWPVDGLPGANPGEFVGGMIIAVHGEFDEVEKVTAGKNSGLKRSFDRTFTIAPGQTGSGIRVVNDMLVIRPYGGSEAWKPTEPQVNAAPAVAPAPAQVSEELKQQMLAELRRVTGLNVQYAGMCLEESGWNYERALESFANAKAGLPPAAFVQ